MYSSALLAAASVELFSAILPTGGEFLKPSVTPVLLAQRLVSPENALEQHRAQSEIGRLCAYVEYPSQPAQEKAFSDLILQCLSGVRFVCWPLMLFMWSAPVVAKI